MDFSGKYKLMFVCLVWLLIRRRRHPEPFQCQFVVRSPEILKSFPEL